VAKIAIISNPRLIQLQGSPGKSLNVDLKTYGNNSDDSELYGITGVFSKPHDGARGLVIDTGGFNIVVATHDYTFDEEIEQGETLLYSYDDTGALKGKILIDIDGKIIVNDGTKYAARKDDGTIVDAVTDSEFITWIATVSAYINGLAPGTIPKPPETVTGKITEGTEEVLLP